MIFSGPGDMLGLFYNFLNPIFLQMLKNLNFRNSIKIPCPFGGIIVSSLVSKND